MVGQDWTAQNRFCAVSVQFIAVSEGVQTSSGFGSCPRGQKTGLDRTSKPYWRVGEGNVTIFLLVYRHMFSSCRTVTSPYPHFIILINSAVCFTPMLFTFTCLPFVLRRMYFIHATYMFSFYLLITCHASMACSYINSSIDLACSLASL